MAIARGSITDEDRNFTEAWENIAVHQNAVIRLDTRGDEKHEVISGRRTFMLTTEERLITQDRIADPQNDPFLNGSFRPVMVPDTINIETNPNAISDEEIDKIFKSSDFAFGEWMETIDSPQTLRRMLDLAPSGDISLKRYKQIESRLAQVRPRTRLGTNDSHLASFLSDRPQAGGNPNGTVASGAGNPRRRGGRSADYR